MSNHSIDEEILTLPELAGKLKIRPWLAYDWSRKRKLTGFPVIRCGDRYVRVRLSEVLDWLSKQQDKD